MERAIATEARLLEAAERHRDIATIPAVDPDEAGADYARRAMGERDDLGPQTGGEAVARVVGDADRVLGLFEAAILVLLAMFVKRAQCSDELGDAASRYAPSTKRHAAVGTSACHSKADTIATSDNVCIGPGADIICDDGPELD